MVDVASIVEDFAHLKIKIRFGEGAPNVEAREDIKITDMGPIVRGIGAGRGEAELVQRRWSWPGPNKRPVYNFRSDGREFNSNRCLIISDGFYEFIDPTDCEASKARTSPGRHELDRGWWLSTLDELRTARRDARSRRQARRRREKEASSERTAENP
jgi:putative SOS response-associated peptidase YedK